MTLGDRWNRLGCLGQLLAVPVALLIIMVVGIKVGQGLGVVEHSNRPFIAKAPRPSFSRKDCLNETASSRFQRSPGELTEDEQGIVARVCAVRQSEYEGW